MIDGAETAGVGLARSKILLALLAALVFLPFLGARDIVISHEARVIQTARQMAEAGWPWNARKVAVPNVQLVEREGLKRLEADPGVPPVAVNPWLVPVLNDEIRLQKPPLPYWCCAVLFRAAGGWSEALARVGGAVLGVLGTFLMYDLARRVLGKRYAMAAGVVWVSSYFIPDEFRKTMADPYLAFFCLLAIRGWVRGGRQVLWFYLGLGLGFLAKGPVVFVHVGVPMGVWAIVRWRTSKNEAAARRRGGWWVHAAGVLLALLVALPWYGYVLANVPHAVEIWRFESVGEMTDNLRNARPWWFYQPLVFQVALPWTLAWVVGMAWGLFEGRWKRAAPAIWWGLIILFFSLVHMKKGAYLLPGMPAQTLVIAVGLVGLMGIARKKGGTWPLWILTLIPAAVAIVLLIKVRPLWVGIGTSGIALALAGVAARELVRRQVRLWLAFTGSSVAIVLLGFFNFMMTPAENERSPREAAGVVRAILSRGPQYTVVPGKLPPELTLYLPLEVNFHPAAQVVVYVLDDPRRRAGVDVAAFEKRLGMGVRSVMEVRSGGRYRVFEVEAERKVLASHLP